MKWTMLVVSLLLTGCYSKNFRLIENDMKVLRGQVMALKAENNSVKLASEKVVISFRNFENTVLEAAKEIAEFRKFKAAHDRCWNPSKYK